MKTLTSALLITVAFATATNAAPYLTAGDTAIQGATGANVGLGWTGEHFAAEFSAREATSPKASLHGFTIDAYAHGPIAGALGGFFTIGNTWSHTTDHTTTIPDSTDRLGWRAGTGLTLRLAPALTLRAAARAEQYRDSILPTYTLDLIVGRW